VNEAHAVDVVREVLEHVGRDHRVEAALAVASQIALDAALHHRDLRLPCETLA
jgi:hypothetical protein